MGTVLVMNGPRQIGFERYEECALAPNEARIETLYSGISAGTQLTLYRGKNPFNEKKYDAELRIFSQKDESATIYPNRGAWGYEEVGRVTAVGSAVSRTKVGDVVYGTWGHRSTKIVTEEFAADHTLPHGLDPIVGIYSQMGSIALNAILDADIHVGEVVAVFGQGVPGQIVAQLARLNGATVIAVDADDTRLALSKQLGAEYAFNSGDCDAALEIKRLTNGGADKVIEIVGRAAALHEAIRSAVFNGRVVCSGFIPTDGQGLYLGEEFHHHRIQLVCSQISGINPALSNCWNRLRMEKTIFALTQKGALNLQSLITHQVDFDKAVDAYHLLDTHTDCMQVVLKF